MYIHSHISRYFSQNKFSQVMEMPDAGLVHNDVETLYIRRDSMLYANNSRKNFRSNASLDSETILLIRAEPS